MAKKRELLARIEGLKVVIAEQNERLGRQSDTIGRLLGVTSAQSKRMDDWGDSAVEADPGVYVIHPTNPLLDHWA